MTEKEKVRVYELAKEVKLDSRRLIDLLHRLHVENIKNHMSTVEPEAVQTVKNIMEGKLPPEPPTTPTVVKKTESSAGETAARETAESAVVHHSNASTTPPASKRPAPTPAANASAGARPATSGTNRNYNERRGSQAPYRDHNRYDAGNNAHRPSGGGAPNRPQGSGRNPAYANSGPRPQPGGDRRQGSQGNSAGRPQGGNYQRPSTNSHSTSARSSAPYRSGPKPLTVPPVPVPPTRPSKEQSRRGIHNNKDRRNVHEEIGRRRGEWDEERYGSKKRSKSQKSAANHQNETAMPPVQRHIVLSGSIMVKDLADQLGVKANELIKRLIALGVMAGVNQELDRDTAVIVATELGATVEERATQEEQEELILQGEDDSPESLTERPPVVTVMGHVDHGKTSLLDRIRATRVTQSEAGGITQHIGASVIEWHDRKVVFLDTPGHEAFTSMRARGAQVTDVAVLVVAANDGVMPQTVEAINHAKAANVPIVVAINKIDLPDANPDKVRTELSNYGLIAEEWGGDTIMVPVSARTGEGIDQLLEALILQADILELKANSHRPAQGTIIEAKLDKGRGPVATVLVAKGLLKVGDVFVAGSVYGRVRALINDRGQRVKSAGPSMPVEVLGFNQLPEAGDDFVILADEKQAKSIADARQERLKRQSESAGRGVSLDDFLQRLKDEAVKELNLVIKADVHGSAEALAQSVSKLSNEEVRVRVLHSGVGTVTETDVMLAQASNAIIVGFGVGVENKARQIAEKEHVDIRNYRVIYDAIDDINKSLKGMLEPKYQEVILGRAEVREVFRVPKVGAVAGCYVTDGKILRSGKIRVIRDGAVVHEGNIGSLKRFKDDVREVASGFECGIGLEKFNDIKVGDIFEAFTEEEVKAS
ncbi:bacterial translation initiation factor 2 (bIF-2) [Sulfobacillus thermosulfidooxidans DSM 9293]|uniref:Translation initiation factor IF-2 n=2 Tax=Sulfobacillus thermosulfidooxidans TaxID=28034 RepID=A0A1W1WK02_SULTA|nr:translation initiation factor IF-2 [Sulfobacillus thermosulfidooxidans]PSR27671.1 MAG: translation initiation factor IF-2 [Sulfobacillus thermosulfidooxidans]SMC06597.1 bacterial translation initiation factor 2 (bIF-2) [Sulfobacillus thermosulfidooxidans DSM 9293]